MSIFRPQRNTQPGWHILTVAGIPFYVQASFLFMIALIIYMTLGGGIHSSVLICFVVFFSLLIHEGGHALACRAFGMRDVSVSLVMFGGYTLHPPGTRGQNLLITMAGPAGTLLLVLLGWFLVPRIGSDGGEFLAGVTYMLNKYWLILNLLPIWPMDGGKIIFHALGFATSDQKAARITSVLSMAGSVALLAYAIKFRQDIILIFFAFTFFMQSLDLWRASKD